MGHFFGSVGLPTACGRCTRSISFHPPGYQYLSAKAGVHNVEGLPSGCLWRSGGLRTSEPGNADLGRMLTHGLWEVCSELPIKAQKEKASLIFAWQLCSSLQGWNSADQERCWFHAEDARTAQDCPHGWIVGHQDLRRFVSEQLSWNAFFALFMIRLTKHRTPGPYVVHCN